MENTEFQNQVVDALAKERFEVNRNDGDSVFMSRRNPKLRHQTQYAEVDSLGFVNGLPISAFLKTL
jgi:hypothetical protein